MQKDQKSKINENNFENTGILSEKVDSEKTFEEFKNAFLFFWHYFN